MLSRLSSVALMGIEALACQVEVDCAEHGFKKAAIVGLPLPPTESFRAGSGLGL